MEKIIEKNIRKTIQNLKKKGVTAMGLENLFQITPTPPQNTATDENVAEYPRLFKTVAERVANSMNFSMVVK